MELTIKKINIIIDALKKSNDKEAKEIIEELESLPVRMDSASEPKTTGWNCTTPAIVPLDSSKLGIPADILTKYGASMKKKPLK